jgi:segregation and condensation protein B
MLASNEDLRGIIEALLFVANEPLTLERLAGLTETEESQVRRALQDIEEEYRSQNRGFQLKQISGGYRLYTHPGFAEYVEKLVLTSDYRRLTHAALETLAIIAYKQPITRAEISAIRGVNVDAVLYSLQDKGLIREAGREKTPGQPILYGTTEAFLEKFGLADMSQLPPLEQFEPDTATKELIRANLTSEAPDEGTKAQQEMSEIPLLGGPPDASTPLPPG